jgi:outer membrane protein OmpA-like peptidoglycan-associated protein
LMSRLAQFLSNHPDIKARIEGHTDSTGSDDYNQALSQRRADAVANALEGRGVSASQIQPVGRGKSAPVAGNDTSAGRQQNRRVEVIFSDTQGQFASR